jgi:hypothetical protein
LAVDNRQPNLSELCYSVRGIIGKFGEFENSYLNECKPILMTSNLIQAKELGLIYFDGRKNDEEVFIKLCEDYYGAKYTDTSECNNMVDFAKFCYNQAKKLILIQKKIWLVY